METYGCNATGGNELSEPIPILSTKFSTLDNTECSFCQSGISTNYYCTEECDNGQRSLDGKKLCGGAFCVFCREGWNIFKRNELSILIALIANK